MLGLPQGSPLSPLLSNIVLHQLDRELEARKLDFVRYADDGAPRALRDESLPEENAETVYQMREGPSEATEQA